MSRYIQMTLIGGVLLLCGMACGRQEAQVAPADSLRTSPVVLQVNDISVDMADVVKTIQQYSERVDINASDAEKSRAVLKSVEYHVIRSVWKDSFLKADSPVGAAAVQAEVDRFAEALPRRKLLQDALSEEGMTLEDFQENTQLNLYTAEVLKRIADALPAVTEVAIDDYYAANISNRRIPESVEARQILIQTQSVGKDDKEARAAEAFQRLKDGESFDEVAWLYSDHVSRSDGGRIGWVWKGMTKNPRLERALFMLEEGQFSEVIKEGNDYAIFMVDKRVPEIEYTEEEFRKRIRERLEADAVRKAHRAFIIQMLREADITFSGFVKPMEEVFWKIFYPEIADEKLGVESPEPTAEVEAP